MTVPGQPAARPEPQPVLSPLTGAAIFLVLSVMSGGEIQARDLLADLAGVQRSVGFRQPEGQLTCVAGVGSTVWDRLFDGPCPAELHPFRELAGPQHRAICTPGDLLFHIRAKHMDLCFEMATQIMNRFAGAVTTDDEIHGFRYFDERDLLGFVDGTENPGGHHAEEAVLIGADDPAFSGSSYVIVQKYIHDMAAWNALTTEEQELVMDRTKLTDIELPDDVKPARSHVALTTIYGPDSAQRQIVRDNMPFGSRGQDEFGTYFIGYAATPPVTQQMLVNMFIGNPPGSYDRILDFSTPVTGGLFFVPSAAFLDAPPAPPVTVAATGRAPESSPAQPATSSAADGSLRIGSLKDIPEA
jgi:putative iron-dependent peroxidase